MPHSAPVALNLLDPHSLLASAGALGIFLVVFAETGLLVGFFLPGDSLLFTAGVFLRRGGLNAPPPLAQGPPASLVALICILLLAAFAGNSTGYYVGKKAGPALYDRGDSRFFKR